MALTTPPGRTASKAACRAGMLLLAVENTAWSAPGSQPKLNITASAVPGCTTCKRSAWLWQCSSYRAAGTPSCSRCFRVDAMASGWMSKPSTLPSGAVSPHRKAVSPPLPQVASMQRRGCASRAARKSCTNRTAVRSGVRRRTSCGPSAAKPNLAQNASSAASVGSGAVNTVACSRSYPAKLRKISFRK